MRTREPDALPTDDGPRGDRGGDAPQAQASHVGGAQGGRGPEPALAARHLQRSIGRDVREAQEAKETTMTAAYKQIQHLLQRSRSAQEKRDCSGAYYALLQACRAYGHAIGAGKLSPNEGDIKDALMDRADEVFDGCVGR
jgi:hypothetical protein